MSDSPGRVKILRTDTVTIPASYNGPPTSGHGGYSAAMAAAPLQGAAAVDLRRPIPLERPLQRTLFEGGRTELRDGETLIAEGRQTELALEPPAAPGWDESVEAAGRYPGLRFHPYETCFGCGTRREEGDGLRIFSGPRSHGVGLAAPWIPHASIAASDGRVPREMIWSALDCPSGWCVGPLVDERFPEGSRVVTAQLAARIDGTAYAGRRYTTLGWLVREDGRKLYTGTALYDEDGTPVAVGTALWIVVPPRN
jgi:hypothetical protein